MATYFLGATSSTNSDAYVIDDRYFSTVVRANGGDNTIDVIPGNLDPSPGKDDAEQEALFEQAITSLGVTSIRWPGGTEAERGIDLVNNGNADVFDWLTNNPTDVNLDVADLQAVIDYCAAHNLSLSFTFPTEFFNGMTESQIDAYEAGIQAFIQTDLLQYAFDLGVTVDSIKIGNEYYINNLTSEEYGIIANRLTQFIGEAVDSFETVNSSATRPGITIESGPIWAEEFGSSGLFYGTEKVITNGATTYVPFVDIIIDQLDAAAREYITAVDIHDLTLRIKTYDDYFGYTYVDDESRTHVRSPLNDIYRSLNTSDTPLQTTSNIWTDEFGHDVELHTLAWTTIGEGGEGGAALSGASMVFLQFYEMSLAGVSYASNFLASGNASTQTLVDKGSTLRAGGEVFRLVQENVQGLRAVEFANDPSVYENDADVEDVVFRAFERDGEIVLNVGNLENASQPITMKQVYAFLSSIEGFSNVGNLNDSDNLHIWGTVLGVADGESVTNPNSDTELEILNAANIVTSNWHLEVELGAYEILQLVFSAANSGGVTMRGHDLADTLVGSNWNDRLYGGNGNDTLHGGGGTDLLYGEDGDDIIYGDLGVDYLRGRNGNDTLYGEGGNDDLEGDAGNDWLLGGTGNDTINGGSGVDNLRGSDGHDTLYGDSGNDDLRGGIGSDLPPETSLTLM